MAWTCCFSIIVHSAARNQRNPFGSWATSPSGERIFLGESLLASVLLAWHASLAGDQVFSLFKTPVPDVGTSESSASILKGMHGLVIMGAVFVENTDPDKNLPRDEQGITPLLLKIRKSGKEDRFAEFLYFHCVVAAPFVFPYRMGIMAIRGTQPKLLPFCGRRFSNRRLQFIARNDSVNCHPTCSFGAGSTDLTYSATISLGLIICPFMLDQFYWAEKMSWLGVAPQPLKRYHLLLEETNDENIMEAWISDVVEKREFAGKKAKLAAAELAKLSRRIFDSPAGNPFSMSYIAAKVEATLSVINVHFSPSIFEGIMSVIECLDTQDHGDRNAPIDPVPIFRFTVDTNLVLFRLHVNLENEGENSTVLVLSIQQLDLWYSLTKVEEWSVRVKTLEIKACSSKDADGHILCSSGNLLKSYSAYGQGMDAHNIRGLILSGNMSTKVQIRDVSLLISDGRWGCSGLLLEVLMRNFLLQANLTAKKEESLVSCDLEVNYKICTRALYQWLHQNMEAVVLMYDDRFDLYILQTQVINNVHVIFRF
ncbi:hypothetical protein ARALYDRAFT_894363 [Arabidopsis lyrata subsp. lyrata]|uniref:Uncharacterized protein n=1 Tax=Arabidopsis lyrata subsp. lyrata TaxID=81972 RepID=D7KUC4_ARALL|nr:hypothetical protein ARALYDRAFT_894363 [Arabidopsis lyrata subsp. lyrata]